jgi:hypothetical protein
LQVLNDVADPGGCEIVLFKGPFAIELNPQMPSHPQTAHSSTGMRLNPFSNEFIAPEDPKERPRIARAAGNTGVGHNKQERVHSQHSAAVMSQPRLNSKQSMHLAFPASQTSLR